jgi:8-oxo-dGTP pyrophosphatase MutT (NUDIX family)
MTDVEVCASGAVVWRPCPDGIEVAVVHRPRYDDWSLPKGKLDEGEGWEDAAVREVAEETGLDVRLGAELPSVSYDDHKGRRKLVRYWLAEARRDEDAGFDPNDEVDELRWLSPAEAAQLLSYERDKGVLAAAAEALG